MNRSWAVILSAALVLNGCAMSVATRPDLAPKASPPLACSNDPAQIPCPPGMDALNAVAWMQSAAEYDAVALSTYQAATAQLAQAMKSGESALVETAKPGTVVNKLAIIVDIDETVLDNSPMQARTLNPGEGFTEAKFAAWCTEEAAREINGAAAFLNFAAQNNVETFYISNRDVNRLEPGKTEAVTINNLKARGFPNADTESVLLRNEKPEWREKGPRRQAVLDRGYRVVMVMGDNLGDFVTIKGADGQAFDLKQRDALIKQHQQRWGSQWFMLPNAMYGSWEDVISVNPGDPETLRRMRKHAVLDQVGQPPKKP